MTLFNKKLPARGVLHGGYPLGWVKTYHPVGIPNSPVKKFVCAGGFLIIKI
jgi:hypothetical protein